VSFRFSLASVLRLRESVERSEELALQKVELELARLRRQIEELAQEVDKFIAIRQQTMKDPTPAYRVVEMQDRVNELLASKQALTDGLPTLQGQRDTQMKRYQAAHNGRRMLTEMSSRQRDAYEQEQARLQQKRLDDIFAARLHRK
jgi:flagellar export protein FliJ